MVYDNKGPVECYRRRRNTIKSVKLSGKQDFMKCFAKRQYGTLNTADFIHMRQAANWIEWCNGGNSCVRGKKVLNTSVKDILNFCCCSF